MDAYYANRVGSAPTRRGDPLAAERKALLGPLERSVRATHRRIAAMSHQLEIAESERDGLRRAGEAILTHQAELPAGSTELVQDGERFPLNSTQTAVENAQAYFARYRKARDTEARLPGLLAEAQNAAEHLAELRTLVEVADQMDAVRALRREVGAATGTRSPRDSKNAAKRAPVTRVSLPDGWEALVGASAEGNATVTFDLARPDDLWLHARGVPGAHVILRGPTGSPPPAVLERAAALAARHSAARDSSAVEIDIAPRRYVKKIPGAAPGLVRYTNERTIRVTPDSG